METLELITKQFTCTFKTEHTETLSTISAIIKQSYNGNYRLKYESRKYLKGELKSENTAYIYYKTGEELKQDFEYHFNLCKSNVFTKEIKITIP